MADLKTIKNILRDEIGLAGENGISIPEIWEHVSRYLAKNVTFRTPISLLAAKSLQGNEDEEDDVTEENDRLVGTFPNLPLDPHLKLQIWKLIQCDVDLRIGNDNQGHSLTLAEAEAAPSQPANVLRDAQGNGATSMGGIVGEESAMKAVTLSNNMGGGAGDKEKNGSQLNNECRQQDHREWRIFASQKLVWNAITGHDEDYEKISQYQWKLLLIIASFGRKGISQTELRVLSGQDKRSVPPRTNSLAQSGYIMKRPIQLPKVRTSWLTLKRFSSENRVSSSIGNTENSTQSVPSAKYFDLTRITRTIMQELKEARNGVMLRADLRRKMGYENNRSFTRAFKNRILRLEQLGCLRRIRIPGNLNLQSGVLPSTSSEVTRLNASKKSTALTKCLKFERDLQPSEWTKALQNVESSEERAPRPDDSDSDEDGGDDAGGDEIGTMKGVGPDHLPLMRMDEPAQVNETFNILNTTDMAEVVLPMWARGTLSTLIFDRIKDSGTSGIVSVDLIRSIGGPFMYRPLEKILSRLVAIESQKLRPSLSHLNIVRHTDLNGRSSVYKYWTHDNYEKMIKESNLGDLSQGEIVDSQLQAETGLDEKGFEVLDKRKVSHHRVTSFLEAQSYDKGVISGVVAPSINRSVTDSGRTVIRWERPAPERSVRRGNASHAKQAQTSRRKRSASVVTDAEVDVDDSSRIKRAKVDAEKAPPKRRGRPPKPKDTPKLDSGEHTVPPDDESTPSSKIAVVTRNGKKKRGRPPKNMSDLGDVSSTKAPANTGISSSVTGDQSNVTPSEEQLDPAAGDDTHNTEKGDNSNLSPSNTQDQALLSELQDNPPSPKAMSRKSRAEIRRMNATAQRREITNTRSKRRTQTQVNDDQIPHISDSGTSRDVSSEKPQIVSTLEPNNSDQGSATVPPLSRSRSTVPETPEPDFANGDQRTSQFSIPMELDDVEPITAAEPHCAEHSQSVAMDSDTQQAMNMGYEEKNIVAGEALTTQASDKSDALDKQPGSQHPKGFTPPEIVEENLSDENGVELEIATVPVVDKVVKPYAKFLQLSREAILVEIIKSSKGAISMSHAFDLYRARYKEKHGGSGAVDRKTFNTVADSLTQKKLFRQIRVSVPRDKGMRVLGKIIANYDLPLSSEEINREKTSLVEHTDLSFLNRVRGRQKIEARPAAPIEHISFDRVYPTYRQGGIEGERKKRTSDERKAALQRITNAEVNDNPKIQSRRRVSAIAGNYRPIMPRIPQVSLDAVPRRLSPPQKWPNIPKGPLPMINISAFDFEYGLCSSDSEDNDSDSEVEVVQDINNNADMPMMQRSGTIVMSSYTKSPALRKTFSKVASEFSTTSGEGDWTAIGSKPFKGYKPSGTQKEGETPQFHRFKINTGLSKRRKRNFEPRASSSKKPSKIQELERVQGFKRTELEEKPGEENEFRKAAVRVPRPRRNRKVDTFDDKTLILAVIISRSLFGGQLRTMKWDVVRQIMPELKDADLKRHWVRIRSHEKARIDSLQRQFDVLYIEALENGDVPLLKKDEPASFDLEGHISWFESVAEQTDITACVDLPFNRSTFDKVYQQTPIPVYDWREPIFNVNSTSTLRKDKFISQSFSVPRSVANDNVANHNAHVMIGKLKRAIKSLLLTDDETYKNQHEIAFEILQKAPEDIVRRAFSQLGDEKLVAGTKSSTRLMNHAINAKFFSTLKTAVTEETFDQALRFDKQVRQDFNENGKSPISALISNGTMAWIFDMLAARTVNLEFGETGLKHAAMGLLEGYQTRGMDAELYEFDLVLQPAKDFNINSTVLISTHHPAIPMGKLESVDNPLCIWQDSNEKVIPGMWTIVLKAILATLVLRPGATSSMVQNTLGPLLNSEDARRTMNWLLEAKYLKSGDFGACYLNRGFYAAVMYNDG